MKKTDMLKKCAAAILLLCFLSSAFASAESISPTTGLPIPGEPTTPVMTVISYTRGKDKLNGKTIEAPGFGKQLNWGGLQADVVFESMLYETGWSRLVFLYHDALVRGEAINAGPVRSLRQSYVALAKLWNAGLVCRASYPYAQMATVEGSGYLFEHGNPDYDTVLTRVEKKKMPENINADVTGIHAMLQNAGSAPSMWSFVQATETEEAAKHCDIAVPATIRWGEEGHSTTFTYDPTTNQYSWFANGAPMQSWHDLTFNEASPYQFANVIILYAKHSFPTPLLPEIDMAEGSKGAAAVYHSGTIQEGSWLIRDGKLLLKNANGEGMLLCPGKTYVALQPAQ